MSTDTKDQHMVVVQNLFCSIKYPCFNNFQN